MSRVSPFRHRFPVDVVGVVLAIGAAYAVLGLAEGSPVRLAVTLVFFLIVPGYALATAVFPSDVSSSQRRHHHPFGPAPGAALDGIERAAVSFGLSLALLPLIGLSIAALSWPFTPGRVLFVTTVVTLGGTLVGLVRRIRLPADVRYDLPIHRVFGNNRAQEIGSNPVTNVILVLAVLTATGALAVGVVAPQDGESYTDMTLLAPSEAGELTASNYPTQFNQGQGQPLVLEVTNHEDRTAHYTVVVKLDQVEGNRITQSDRMYQFERELPAEGTWQVRHTVTPTFAGEDLRLTYLLYQGSPPDNPHPTNAYRFVYLSIDVSA